MARPTDWSAVDLPIDPVPGDAAEIRQSASGARSIEQAITEQVNRLNSLKDGEGWESESGTKFRDSAGDLAGAIEKAKGRYTQLAAALDDWANGLEGIQQEADAALARAQEARDAHRAAAGQTLTAAPDTPEHQDQVDAQDRAVDAAQSDIDAAKAIIFRLAGRFGEEGEYGDLASQVADRIRSGADDGLKDGWFDHVKQAIHDARGVLNVIKDALDAVGSVLLVVTVIAAIFFPAALPVIALIGLAVAGAKLLITATQSMAGDATAKDVGDDAIGFALAAVGFGAAKYAGSAMGMLRGAVGETRAASAAAAARTANAGVGGEMSAFLRGAGEGVREAEAVGRKPLTALLDTYVTGGLMETTQVLKLAPDSALAREAATRAALANGVVAGSGLPGLPDLPEPVETVITAATDWNGYWKTKSEIHVGSL
ncbi:MULTISPECIES: putative T7SS-secreted protein [Curtobacterium]|uniref:putative T7SS-secreted protein n=1 Tax=Curtobacterium TaxID=2034 RepID=UPI0005AC6C36|nr:hypothetical protein [Curtobacterium flaccumfaciens]KIQ06640.1 hypothetical protein RU06_11870 [Curtobacterium flaccumfaciens]MCS6573858.1 WXG100 family type VII secretion target [Curtobacterium flaccumfaciens pv. flaccumfaciens]MDD1385336.1 hypothetical protein [Curtobacterium flaccumfaciens pv. poinsettiae]MDQ0537996.1 hypothetical protein [Curtobacterium flaccumfaciens]TPG06704.1 hypothetical protein EAH85_08090 [Curtobacterium flaccumfaciens]